MLRLYFVLNLLVSYYLLMTFIVIGQVILGKKFSRMLRTGALGVVYGLIFFTLRPFSSRRA